MATPYPQGDAGSTPEGAGRVAGASPGRPALAGGAQLGSRLGGASVDGGDVLSEGAQLQHAPPTSPGLAEARVPAPAVVPPGAGTMAVGAMPSAVGASAALEDDDEGEAC
eukprot:4153447-Prymnesium_polylepis.1